MSYQRVLPRDLFNEAKLLKCMGRLLLLMHDEQTPCKMGYDVMYDEPFKIDLLDEGSLTISNLQISMNGKLILFKTTYNSKAEYPLFAQHDLVDYEVFDEQGEFTEEFIGLAKELE